MLVGEVGDGAGAGAGDVGGAGGFCATASGARTVIARANTTKMRNLSFIGRSLGRKASVVQNSRAYIRSSQGLVVGPTAIARLARIYWHGLHAMARRFGSVGTETRRDLFMSQSHHGIDPHGARRRDEARQKRDRNQQHNRQAEQPGVVHRHLEHKRLQQPRRKPTTD